MMDECSFCEELLREFKEKMKRRMEKMGTTTEYGRLCIILPKEKLKDLLIVSKALGIDVSRAYELSIKKPNEFNELRNVSLKLLSSEELEEIDKEVEEACKGV